MRPSLLYISTSSIFVVASRVELAHVFNFDELPPCAKTCKILEISEANCVPPAAPVSDQRTYADCACQSKYLRSLHTNGEICHGVCAHKDDVLISKHYKMLCNGTPAGAPTTLASSSAAPTSAVTSATEASKSSTVEITGTMTHTTIPSPNPGAPERSW